MPYRLATPQNNLSVGVSKGFRTHDPQSHNLALYQLSYTHHKCGLVRLEGFEPPTFALEGHCSIQLSYKRKYTIFVQVRTCIARLSLLVDQQGLEPWTP